jgi:hypothetical protein
MSFVKNVTDLKISPHYKHSGFKINSQFKRLYMLYRDLVLGSVGTATERVSYGILNSLYIMKIQDSTLY